MDECKNSQSDSDPDHDPSSQVIGGLVMEISGNADPDHRQREHKPAVLAQEESFGIPPDGGVVRGGISVEFHGYPQNGESTDPD